MSIADKFEIIADEVYEKGTEKGVSDFWDIFQNYGKRLYYIYAFSYWGETDINPKYMISPTNTAFQNAFQGADVKNIDWTKFDLSKCGTFNQSFNNCSMLESIDAELAPTSEASNVWAYIFSGCRKLKSIKKITAQETHAWTKAFNLCGELTDIAFDGVIGNDIDLSACTKLSRDSVVSIFTSLSDSVNGKTASFSSSVQSRCNVILLGLDKGFGFGDTYTSNGVTFTANGDIISWTGTPDGIPIAHLLNEEYTVTGEGDLVVVFEDLEGAYNNIDDFCMNVRHPNGEIENFWSGYGNTFTLSSGDTICDAQLFLQSPIENISSMRPVLSCLEWDRLVASKQNWTISLV